MSELVLLKLYKRRLNGLSTREYWHQVRLLGEPKLRFHHFLCGRKSHGRGMLMKIAIREGLPFVLGECLGMPRLVCVSVCVEGRAGVLCRQRGRVLQWMRPGRVQERPHIGMW